MPDDRSNRSGDSSAAEARVFYAPDACRFREASGFSSLPLSLSSEESHHASHVLRMRAEDSIRLFDGAGYFYEGKITEIRKREVWVSVHSAVPSQAEPRAQLILMVGVLKGRKNDLIIQKSVELGVSELVFYCAGRSIGRRGLGEANDASDERSKRIVISASKQCGRAGLMPVRSKTSLAEAINPLPQGSIRYAFWEGEQNVVPTTGASSQRSIDLANAGVPVCALIGPEGGMSNDEIELLRAADFETRSLGMRILRAETAALATAAILLHLMGELGSRLFSTHQLNRSC